MFSGENKVLFTLININSYFLLLTIRRNSIDKTNLSLIHISIVVLNRAILTICFIRRKLESDCTGQEGLLEEYDIVA